jgi:hypothetical protein
MGGHGASLAALVTLDLLVLVDAPSDRGPFRSWNPPVCLQVAVVIGAGGHRLLANEIAWFGVP